MNLKSIADPIAGKFKDIAYGPIVEEHWFHHPDDGKLVIEMKNAFNKSVPVKLSPALKVRVGDGNDVKEYELHPNVFVLSETRKGGLLFGPKVLTVVADFR